MNLYFWFFAICAFGMTPVEAETWIQLNQEVRWRITISVAGVRVFCKRKKQQGEKRKAAGVFKGLFSPGGHFLRAFVGEDALKGFLRAFRWRSARLVIHLSFDDAALTAMGYSLVRTLMQMLANMRLLPEQLTGRVEADFQAQGSCAEFRGIFCARLGTLLLAGMRLGLAALRVRARLALEEEKYAASH